MMFGLWLSAPSDMLKENNPATMAVYAGVAAASAAAVFFGVKFRKRSDDP